MKRINWKTAAALVVVVAVIMALAVWGGEIGLTAEQLSEVRIAAGLVGSLIMALMPKLFADKDGDGVPDILQTVAAVVIGVGLAAAVSGCGAQLTAAQRASLATETQRCLLAEREIVDMPCGDLSPEDCRARDMGALAIERARCDTARDAIVGGR